MPFIPKFTFRQEKSFFFNTFFAKLQELRFNLIPFAPYSPDLVPGDYSLLQNRKKLYTGRRFASIEKLKAETNVYFAVFEKSFYTEGESEDKVYGFKRRLRCKVINKCKMINKSFVFLR